MQGWPGNLKISCNTKDWFKEKVDSYKRGRKERYSRKIAASK